MIQFLILILFCGIRRMGKEGFKKTRLLAIANPFQGLKNPPDYPLLNAGLK